MATYTTITDGQVDEESPITTSLMTALRDNPTAIAEGASGAPKVMQAALGGDIYGATVLQDYPWGESDIESSSISRTRLKTGLYEDDTTLASIGDTVVWSFGTVGAGFEIGEYGFAPLFRVGTGGQVSIGEVGYTGSRTGSASDWETAPYWMEAASAGTTVYAKVRYIQGSPPYDLGDGEIPLFAYALIRDGQIVRVSVADDAPWAMRKQSGLEFTAGAKKYALQIPQGDLQAARRAMSEWPVIEEVTTAAKNAGIGQAPHPYANLMKPGDTVVMVDPVSDFAHEWAILRRAGYSLGEVLRAGDVLLDNEALSRKTPPGVVAVAARWR